MIPADFPWRAGMRFRMDNGTHHRLSAAIGHRLRSQGEDCYGYMEPIDAKVAKSLGFVPDLSDPATIGALAGAVREAYRDASFHAHPNNAGGWTAHSWSYPEPRFAGVTEGEAWLAAWKGRAK